MVPAASVGVPDRFMDAGQIQNTYLSTTDCFCLRKCSQVPKVEFSRIRELRSLFFSELSHTFHTKGLFILPIDYLSTESILPMDRCMDRYIGIQFFFVYIVRITLNAKCD